MTFHRIVLIGRSKHPAITNTLQAIYHYLTQHAYQVFIEKQTAQEEHCIDLSSDCLIDANDLAGKIDLAIVIGGDGSLLRAAHLLAAQSIPILGINRGRLGFLTDISPQKLSTILQVLTGHYQQESRFLMHAQVIDPSNQTQTTLALNDVVLLPGNVAQLIEFEIYIDDVFLCSQRADGTIIATPTGSTAYALSAGGPIIHPEINALLIVPMFAHTLTNRPIVISGDSRITIVVTDENHATPGISCDGQPAIRTKPGTHIEICKNTHPLILIHPPHYSYFETLRNKLHWGKKITE